MSARDKPAPGPDAQPEEAEATEDRKGRGEREFQRAADVILGLLEDGLPHTRAEIAALAAEHSISDGRLAEIKRRMRIRHVRVRTETASGEESGRSVFAWLLDKEER